MAAENGHEQVIDLLIKEGADKDATSLFAFDCLVSFHYCMACV